MATFDTGLIRSIGDATATFAASDSPSSAESAVAPQAVTEAIAAREGGDAIDAEPPAYEPLYAVVVSLASSYPSYSEGNARVEASERSVTGDAGVSIGRPAED